MKDRVSNLRRSRVSRIAAMVARWTARSIILLIAAAASLGVMMTLLQGDGGGILQSGVLCIASWVVCRVAWRREALGGLLVMAGVSFALVQTYAGSRDHPFEGYETTLMSSAWAALMIPGALLLVSYRLRCFTTHVATETRTGPDPGVWPDWQWTARISSAIALLYTSRLMVLVGRNLEAYAGSIGVVLCGFLAIGLLGGSLSWPFPRSGGVLLMLSVVGFSASLSFSGFQSWYAEPERTLGYIAITVPSVVAACCQFVVMKPGTFVSTCQERRRQV